MDAAVDQLRSRGVLAGLNLREVADAVGVTPANIYHYFGSRQGLLRAALQRETARLGAPIADLADATFVDRRLGMFDAIAATPELALTALLALDGDPDYEPMPFLDTTRADYQRRVAAGELPADLDVEAVHLMSLAMAVSTAIYGDVAARQLGVPVEDLRARARATFARMLTALVG
jgi:AcrR family transcriptional regulator